MAILRSPASGGELAPSFDSPGRRRSGGRCARSVAIVLTVAIVIHASLSVVFSLSRLYELKTLAFDLGAFNQVMHSIVATGTPTSTLTPALTSQHWFGFHFSPILYGLFPIYLLDPGPAVLLVIQAVAISSAAWPIYLTVTRMGASTGIAMVWSLAYLLNPFVLNGMVWDFHEVAVATPMLAFGIWAVVAKRWRWLLFLELLLLLTKEHYGIAVAGFGLLWGIRHREWRRAGTIALLGVASCLLIVNVVMPHFSGGPHLMLDEQLSAATPRYQWLFHPASWFNVLPELGLEWLRYAGYLLIPFCLLPLAGLEWMLPALADLMVITASQEDFYRSVFSYHTLPIVPMLTIAAFRGSTRLSRTKWFQGGGRRLAGYALLLAAVCGWMFAPFPLPLSTNVWEAGAPRWRMVESDALALSDIRSLVPSDARIAVQCNVGVWFSDRPRVSVFPFQQSGSDYIILHLSHPFRRATVAMGSPYCVPPETYVHEVGRLLASGEWGIVLWRAPWLVLRRHAHERAQTRQAVRESFRTLARDLAKRAPQATTLSGP